MLPRLASSDDKTSMADAAIADAEVSNVRGAGASKSHGAIPVEEFRWS